MIFAHLPAGYLFGKMLAGRTPHPRLAMACSMLGSILPDFDLAYDWFIDPQNGGHRLYVTHTPILWIAIASLSWLILRSLGRQAYGIYVWITLSSLLLCHLFLDTIASDIRWLFPVSNQPMNLIRVPRTSGSWMASYFNHWSFWLELVLITIAASVWFSTQVAQAHDRSGP